MPEDTGTPPDLLPLRMLNEYAYCPRLFHFMHVEGRWADNQYTIEGRHAHRRVDALDHLLPDSPEAAGAKSGGERKRGQRTGGMSHRRWRGRCRCPRKCWGYPPSSIWCSTDGDEAVPVETKRGRVPENAERSWEPERVQLMGQGLLLREAGYRCDHGLLYFAGSRTRVRIDFTEALERGRWSC